MAEHSWVGEGLEKLNAAHRLRFTRKLRARTAVEGELDGRTLVLFSTNDYLGLSCHPEVMAAAAKVMQERGMGSRGSPLLCGYSEQHEALEHELATLKAAEAALVFPTGYAANIAALTALDSLDAEIFSDELNHASIIDGCRLARCRKHIFAHRDCQHLEDLLRRSSAARKVVVTDSVFSMEGDCAPLAQLVELKKRYDLTLVIDEAHATLVMGERGGGLAEALGLSEHVDLQVGTLSKAVAAQGGYVATSRAMRAWLLNRGRTYIYSTALPLPVVAAARAALRVANDGVLRGQLCRRVNQLGECLGRTLATPIVAIVVGGEQDAMDASAALWERGFHVPAVRPPTVPECRSRLRLAVSAVHSDRHITELASAIADLGL